MKKEDIDHEEMIINALPIMAIAGIVLGVCIGLYARVKHPESCKRPEKIENRSYCNPSPAALWILSQMP